MTEHSRDGMDRLERAYDELTALHGWEAMRTPRNMLLALTGRVGAVAAALQFSPEQGPAPEQVTPELRGELADCLVYLVGLTNALGVDVLVEATTRIETAVSGSRAAR